MKATYEFPTPEQAQAFAKAVLGTVGVTVTHRVADIHVETDHEIDEATATAREHGAYRSNASERLAGFVARASGDTVKRDLELTCAGCGETLCDIEAGDTLENLVGTTEDHDCKAARGMIGVDPAGVSHEDLVELVRTLQRVMFTDGITVWEHDESPSVEATNEALARFDAAKATLADMGLAVEDIARRATSDDMFCSSLSTDAVEDVTQFPQTEFFGVGEDEVTQ